jgi:hypothetical protein
MAYFFAVLRDLCGLQTERSRPVLQANADADADADTATGKPIRHDPAPQTTDRGKREEKPHLDAGAIGVRQLWYAALAELRTTIPAQSFQTWLKNTTIIAFEGNTVVIAVPSNFAKEWLETRYSRQIAETLYNVIGHRVEVLFEVKAPGVVG